jgi:hypothetical protein
MSLEAGGKYTVTAQTWCTVYTLKINTFPVGVAGGGRKVHGDHPEPGGQRPLLIYILFRQVSLEAGGKYTVTAQNLADSVHFSYKYFSGRCRWRRVESTR